MKYLTRDDIRMTSMVMGEPFEITELGGFVNMRKWTGAQRAGLLVKVTQATSGDELKDQDFAALFRVQAEIVAITLCDEQGTPLFDHKNMADVELIEQLPADVLQKIYDECGRRNGLFTDALKEEVKNSEASQNVGS